MGNSILLTAESLKEIGKILGMEVDEVVIVARSGKIFTGAVLASEPFVVYAAEILRREAQK